MNPFLVIHEATHNRWLFFSDPVSVITATTPEAIQPALRDIESSVNSRGLFAAGFLSYEAAPAFDPALKVRPDASGFPLLWFGLFAAPQEFNNLSDIDIPQAPISASTSPVWQPSISKADYLERVARIREYLKDGDSYQVNYTFKLATASAPAPWPLFLNLVAGQGSHYSAFVDIGTYCLCSASPELFFKLNGTHIESHPMKGTIQRGTTLADDRHQAQMLQESPKNRAENVMIVDMIRNDLGRIAIPGSVAPEPLFTVKRYPTVWQMVSTVTAQTHASLGDIFTALFPCASITGAPKPRTMEIIAETEATPRHIYTGTIGYLAPGRRAQFNVAIRTVLVDQPRGQAEYGVGGGIVWDSESSNEYDECWLKAKVLVEKPVTFDLLETLLWSPNDGFFLLERHLKRLLDSAEYFDIPVSPENVTATLQEHMASLTAPRRVRLLVDQTGKTRIESVAFDPISTQTPARVKLASHPINRTDRFLYHKTTRRHVYDSAKADCAECDDVLLWNDAGELTESTIANIVVEHDGELITPPIRCGLLPGVYREELLAQGKIKEAIIRIDTLPRASKVYLINSLRKWREAVIV